MLVVGFVAYNIGGITNGIVSDLLTIISIILIIGGFIELFKKKKVSDEKNGGSDLAGSNSD